MKDGPATVMELLGPPVDISAIHSKDEAEATAFELYKETARVLTVVSHICEGTSPENLSLPRNQAICVGLLVRIVKFMVAIIQLSAKDRRGDVVLALNRCILESTINLEFLATKHSAEFFDRFVENSLGPERELYDLIHNNIADRGGDVWPIETRMLKSIERICKLSSIKIEDVKQKYPEWGQNLRERLKALGKEDLYLTLQRIPSHAIHGSWVDIVLHHVDADEAKGSFKPNSESKSADARLLTPIAFLVLEAALVYLRTYFGKHDESKTISDRIEDLEKRIGIVDQQHEHFFDAG